MLEPAESAAPPTKTRPYAPSWLNRLTDAIDRLPGPTWLAYGVFAAALVILTHTQAWSTGRSPVGALDLTNTYFGLLPVVLVWFTAYLTRVAASAFDAFRPALEVSDGTLARLRYELTVVPAGISLVLAGASFGLTLVGYVLDPEANGIVGYPPVVLALRFIFEGFNGAVLGMLIYQLFRQMRQISRILALSVRIDIFAPGPLYAFSKLTSRTGILLVGTIASSIVITPPLTDAAVFLIWAPWFIFPPILAVAAFVVPIYGLHGRLVDEKERLQGAAEERLKLVLAELNGDVDARDLGRADGLSKTLASMVQQRDLLAKLPTWPWSTGTFRAFVTAIFLPIALFLVQRLLSQFV